MQRTYSNVEKAQLRLYTNDRKAVAKEVLELARRIRERVEEIRQTLSYTETPLSGDSHSTSQNRVHKKVIST